MNVSDARALAPLLDAALRGRFIKNISAPDPFFLGLAFSAEETLGLSCRPEAFHVGLCSLAWPEVQAPEVLRTHLKGARVERVEVVDGEPILWIVLAGGAAFVCESLGRPASAFESRRGSLGRPQVQRPIKNGRARRDVVFAAAARLLCATGGAFHHGN